MAATGLNLQINVNNNLICYDDQGDSNIPLIFIHGFPFDKTMWEQQRDYFKMAHRVIVYDIQGFGRSTCNLEESSMDIFADDLISLMDALEIKNSVVCGLSMGGFIALNAINRYPQRFSGLVLCDTQCIADTPETREKRMDTIRMIEKDGLQEYTKTFIPNIFHENTFTENKNLIRRIEAIIMSNNEKTIIKGLKALANRVETCSSLSAITVPTLIICGSDDKVTPVEQSEKMLESIPNATLKIIEEAGHLSNMEQPDEFNHHVENFLFEHLPTLNAVSTVVSEER
jgi:3-oxoadipate enol-lactonase